MCIINKMKKMQAIIEKLAVRLGEGYLASGLDLRDRKLNIFHREVYLHRGSELSFINGMVATGIRASAQLDTQELEENIHIFRSAGRRLLPLVVHLRPKRSFGALHPLDPIMQLAEKDGFVLIAGSAQEEVYLSLIAHRIAELSLVPGIVMGIYDEGEEDPTLPSDEIIRTYLGDPDDMIASPTPAQEMIFGKTRRRVPNWFSLDTPVMSGVAKDGAGLSFEMAARREFIQAHIEELIDRAFQEFEKCTGIHIPQVDVSGSKAANGMIVIGDALRPVSDPGSNVSHATDIIRPIRFFPLPENILADAIRNKKAVTVLEPLHQETGADRGFFNKIKSLSRDSRTHWYRAMYRDNIQAGEIELAIDRMGKGQEPNEYYLGIPFTKESGRYPRHDILLKEISQRYPELKDRSLVSDAKNPAKQSEGQVSMPLSLRAYKDQGANFTRLSRFFADTAFFHASGREEELVADPFQATTTVPAASSGFFSRAAQRENIPAFLPEKCTSCGDCFIYCPHGAAKPLAIAPGSLIQTGIAMATKKGMIITRLTPMVRHFDTLTASIAEEYHFEKAGEILPVIFDAVAGQMNIEGENLATAREEFDAVMSAIGEWPVSLTDPMYHIPESTNQGSGEFFTISFDPGACTGCGICSEVCQPGAIEMLKQDDQILAQTSRVHEIWEQLPDTSGETIRRLYLDPDYPAFAALMLSRNYASTMTGGPLDERGGPAKTLLHWVTASAEAVVQPRYLSMMEKLDGLIESISENIHKKLSKALPKENLEQLSRSLEGSRGKRLSLKEIITHFDGDETGALIDSSDMRRKTKLLDELKTLKWVLHEGPGGVGRSRYGMLLAAGASMPWARTFPGNHFTSPSLVHWNGSAPAETLGLFFGNLRFVLDQIKLIRRAELEVRDKYDPSAHDLEIAELSWDDLSSEERKWVPPILVIADRKDLESTGWGGMHRLLADRYPVKVLLFDSVAPAGNEEIASMAISESWLMSAIALKNAFVLRGNPGHAGQLYEGLMDGLATDGPALFMLYATDPYKHTVDMGNWSQYALLAANSRAFPSVRFAPSEDRDHLAGELDLSGNADMLQDWVREDIPMDGEQTMSYTITWADWAFTQKDWKIEFEAVEPGSSNIPVADYLDLDTKQRSGKVPVIARYAGEKLNYFAASDRVVAMAEFVRSSWRTLQEMAGLRTEFPEELKKRVTAEFELKLAEESQRLEKEYQEKLHAIESSQAEIWKERLKERLLTLSAMAKKQIEN